MAAFFNFAAAFIFGTVVAKTIGSGMVRLESVDRTVIFAGLMGAIVWNIITWYFGLPTSSSHALIGGYALELSQRALLEVGVYGLIAVGLARFSRNDVLGVRRLA